MKTATIQKYVDDKNRWNALFKDKVLDLNNAADRQEIAQALDCDLSPENLTCDGELSAAQVRTKYRYLTTAAKELMALDPTVTFYEFS